MATAKELTVKSQSSGKTLNIVLTPEQEVELRNYKCLASDREKPADDEELIKDIEDIMEGFMEEFRGYKRNYKEEFEEEFEEEFGKETTKENLTDEEVLKELYRFLTPLSKEEIAAGRRHTRNAIRKLAKKRGLEYVGVVAQKGKKAKRRAERKARRKTRKNK